MSTSAWSVDRSRKLGSGGFGDVFLAHDPDEHDCAAKIVAKVPGADRDLLAISLGPSPHLVPVLHVEETADELILYMPLASGSLRDRLTNGDPIHFSEALDILQQIAAGLVAMENDVVHRDLKPENVLLLNGQWAICDFGISRYTEASTSPDTRKYSMSPPYAAPEQWRYDHATRATDVYAFGVIAHEVLGGARPFLGPDADDYRQQHLTESPPKLSTTKKLASLVFECLFKAPTARPTAQNLTARLAVAGMDARQPGASALADAHQVVVEATAAAQKAVEEERTEEERRNVLAEAADQLFGQIRSELVEAIQDSAPAAAVRISGDGHTRVVLGLAALEITAVNRSDKSQSPFDVISFAAIRLSQTNATGRGLSRSHSFYYANFEAEDSYRWYEIAFCGGFNGVNFDHEPRSLPPQDGLRALERAVGGDQLGRPIVVLDIGELEGFVDEWGMRLGLTAQGKFPRVTQLPEGNPIYPRR